MAARLLAAGIEKAEREAELLLFLATGINRVALYRDNPEISSGQFQEIQALVSRRERHEPLQYIIGEVDFLDLKLSVGPGVLIPRPETELMAEYAIREVKSQNPRLRILDICTGSGCIALSLAKQFPDASVFAADISEKAIEYAKRNKLKNSLHNVYFFRNSLLDAVRQHAEDSQFDMVIANPPYIRSGDIRGLAQEIKDWEPVTALDGGPDGMACYRNIVPEARKILKNHGILMLEIGEGCSGPVRDMIVSAGYARCESIRDYAGHERIIRAEWIS